MIGNGSKQVLQRKLYALYRQQRVMSFQYLAKIDTRTANNYYQKILYIQEFTKKPLLRKQSQYKTPKICGKNFPKLLRKQSQYNNADITRINVSK